MARYEAGETLSSIARTYDCSPPAISYVVSRSRARQAGEPPRPATAGEPQLIKTAAGNGADGTGNRDSAAMPPAETAPPAMTTRPPEAPPAYANPTAPQAGATGDRRFEIRPGNGNGFVRPVTNERVPQVTNPFAPSAPSPAPRPADSQPPPVPASHGPAPQGPANSDPRGRLHLSLGDGPHANGGAQPGESRFAERPQPPMPQHPPQNGGGERPAWAAPTPHRYPGPAEQHRHVAPPAGAPMHVNGGHQGPFGRGEAQTEHRKEGGGAFIDAELRARVDSDIAAFLSAFDMALAEDTSESRASLREATDRLLRAGARTRIELERLEARMPLPPRDTGRQEPAWRQR
jgi:transposase-like protein